jgi:hypothetical protein
MLPRFVDGLFYEFKRLFRFKLFEIQLFFG